MLFFFRASIVKMTPLAIFGYALILFIVAWVVIAGPFVNGMITIRRDVDGPMPSYVAVSAILIIAISGIGAAHSLFIKK